MESPCWTELGMKELEAGEISKKVQESRLKWYSHGIEKRIRIRRQDSDGDGGAGEKKERTIKAEVVG